ncbi:hypothetical protein [Brevibacillus migulae]|uniref:hypothetical protein n=1 Tax=Brevibacillus migulae TaxID=1644114 RepID=UPI00106E4CF0|nr:hypothetical protein [Brevibacillus migulae]
MLGWVIAVLFLLLMIVLALQERSEEKGFWGKIILYFLSAFFFFRFEAFVFPLGIAIAFYLLFRRTVPNQRIKVMTLLFAIATFFFVHFLPPYTIQDWKESRERVQLESQFEEVVGYYSFSEDAQLQEKVRKYVNRPPEKMSVYDGDLMFLTWALDEQGIPIKNAEWLASKAAYENGIKWHYSEIEEDRVSHVYLEFPDNTQYFGVIKKGDKTSLPYLAIIIEHKGVKTGFPTLFDFH